MQMRGAPYSPHQTEEKVTHTELNGRLFPSSSFSWHTLGLTIDAAYSTGSVATVPPSATQKTSCHHVIHMTYSGNSRLTFDMTN